MPQTLLADATFVIQDAHTVRRDASLLIEDARITGVGDRSDFPPADDRDIIDCRGLILMPGLVNAHTHLFQVLTRGVGKHWRVRQWAERVTYPMARKITDQEYFDAVLLACADAIRNGTTALVDHPTHYARFHADGSCRAILAAGIRGAVALGGADQSLVDSGETRAPAEDVERIREFVGRWQGSGSVQPWIGPAGFHTCTPASLRAYKQLAIELGVRFHTHLAESAEGVKDAMAAGHIGEVSWARALDLMDTSTSFAHGVYVEPEEFDLLAESGCQIVHCPTSNQIMASGIASIPSMREKEIPIALATDGASSNDSLDMVAELKAATLIHRAVSRDATITSAEDAFEAATLGGAAVLGIENLGRLAEGYLADVVGLQLEGNPSLTPCTDPVSAVVFYASGRDVVLTIANGITLYWRGNFLNIDVQETIDRVTATVARHGTMTGLEDPI